MILLGSAILLAIALLLLLISAARIAFGLIKIACYLIALAVMLPVAAFLGLCVAVQWCARFVLGTRPAEAEPMITIVYADEEAPIELPRRDFRRLRG
jgi:hypothetical protein